MSEELQETAEVEEQPQVQADVQEQPEESFTDRPDWLPEKFKTPEDMAKSYGELERGFYQRKDDLREQIIDEINQDAMKDAPAMLTMMSTFKHQKGWSIPLTIVILFLAGLRARLMSMACPKMSSMDLSMNMHRQIFNVGRTGMWSQRPLVSMQKID